MKIIDVATSQQEETSEECVFLIFLLPEKWRVLSVWLTSMFFTCDIFKLCDPALIGMQKVWLFSRPTPKGLSVRDRWQQELWVGHLQVYSGGRKLKRNSFRNYECQPYAKSKRFDEKVHRLLSYENIMCIRKQTDQPRIRAPFSSLQPKISLQCRWELNFLKMQLIKYIIQRDSLMTSDPMQIVYMNFLPLHIPSQILHTYIRALCRNPHLS